MGRLDELTENNRVRVEVEVFNENGAIMPRDAVLFVFDNYGHHIIIDVKKNVGITNDEFFEYFGKEVIQKHIKEKVNGNKD